MIIIRDDLWLCVDCTIYACNADTSGIYDDDREREVTDGVNDLGPHLVANFDTDTGDGHEEFSHRGCDGCGSGLSGELHRFAVLGPRPRDDAGRFVSLSF